LLESKVKELNMSDEIKKTPAETARKATEDAVKHGENISDDVRDITVEALSKHHLNYGNIKSVIKAVLEGAKDAVDHRSDDMKDTFKEVIEGLDEALERSAHASKLAIEEMAGNIKDFTEQDLKRAMNDLKGLEDIFFESLTEVAKSSRTMAADTIQNLVNHFKNSGTAVGQRANEEIAALTEQFEKSGKENIAAVSNATRTFTMDVARAASGFLAGLADSLGGTKKEKGPDDKQD
jgi:hypothetical protein